MKYSLIKRALIRIPGIRKLGADAFLYLPTTFSPIVYAILRKFIFVDNNRRLPAFKKAFSLRPDADYLEFGVARGTSLISAYQLAKKNKLNSMRFFAFDSFQGLPDSEGKFEQGDMAYGINLFQRFCEKAGVKLDRVIPISGFFENSLVPEIIDNYNLVKKPYIVHIDCDLYKSTVTVLKFMEPILDVGSVIIFDDWHNFDHESNPRHHGEQRAFYEWEPHKSFVEFHEIPQWNKAFVKIK